MQSASSAYAKSPRHVTPARLRPLDARAAALRDPGAAVRQCTADLIEDAIAAVPNALLQFHGDEHEPACSRYGRPYLRALRMDTKGSIC